MSRPIVLRAGSLRIEFSRNADRYRHEIIECAGEPCRLLLASVEGTGNEDWPASPPWQELHLEQRGEGKQVILLVGRAGRSHWSLSVEVDVSQDALLFDVACRSPAGGVWLGSSYRLVEADLPASLRTGDRATLSSSVELQVLEGEMRCDAEDVRVLRIAPRQESAASGKIRTCRWRYRIGR